MNRNEIIEKLFTGENFNSCIGKMEPEHLREDLRQEVILVICELPEKRIIQLHREQALEFFTVRVILNQIKSKTSPFHKKYRKIHAGYTENINYKEHGEEFKTGAQQQGFGMGKYIKACSDQPDITNIEHEERELREFLEDLAIEEVEDMRNDKINNGRWYAGELIALYLKHGNFRAIQKETGIPLVSCYVTIKRAFNSIKKKTKPVLLDQKSLNMMSLTNAKSYLLNPESKVNK